MIDHQNTESGGIGWMLPWIVAAAGGAMLFWAARADAAECPTPQPCKWISLSPQEEAILIQPNGILDTASQGRKIELEAATMYFRQRIKEAPQGGIKQPEAPKP